MKYYKFFKLLPFLALVFLMSCEKDKGEVAFEGDALLNFSFTTSEVLVLQETGSVDYELSYGTFRPVVGDHTVTLIPDVENSTAVLGVDYEIIDNTDVLASGKGYSSFTLRFFEEPATLAGKVVVFSLQSATLSNADFNTTNTLTVKLTCPVEETMFVGSYLIEQLSPYVDGPTLDDGSVVTLNVIPGSISGRTFMTKNYPTYCTPLRPFNFDLICGDVIVRPSQPSSCQCTAAGLFFGPATVPSNYDIADDSVFELTFTDDVTSNCGPAAQTTYRFTKQ